MSKKELHIEVKIGALNKQLQSLEKRVDAIEKLLKDARIMSE